MKPPILDHMSPKLNSRTLRISWYSSVEYDIVTINSSSGMLHVAGIGGQASFLNVSLLTLSGTCISTHFECAAVLEVP